MICNPIGDDLVIYSRHSLAYPTAVFNTQFRQFCWDDYHALGSFHDKSASGGLQQNEEPPLFLRVRLRGRRLYNRYPNPAYYSRVVVLISEAALHYANTTATLTIVFTSMASKTALSLIEAEHILQNYSLDEEYILELYEDLVLSRRPGSSDRESKFYGNWIL